MAELGVKDFVDFIKKAEGFSPSVYDDNGHPAVGFGHRVQPGESFDGDIDEGRANELLHGDILAARNAASSVSKGLGFDFDSLEFPQQAKLIERAFSMGPEFHLEKTSDGRRGFPRWTQAVLAGDTEAELREHERNLPRRDRLYEETFHPGLRRAEEGEADGPGEAPAEPPRSLDETLRSTEFRHASPSDQIDLLADTSPLFRELLDRDPEKAKAWAAEKAEQVDPGVLESLAGGVQTGIGITQWSLANAAMIAENLGLENDFDDSWRAAADLNFLSAQQKIGSDWQDIVASVVGGIPGGLVVPGVITLGATYGLPLVGAGAGATTALAPVIGFGTAGALGAADEGFFEAGKRGLIDAALGAIPIPTQHLGRLSRMGIESAAAFFVSDQPDPIRRAIEAGALGVLAGTPAKRAPFEVMKRLGVKDRVAEHHHAVEQARRQHEAHVAATKAAEDFVVVGDDGMPAGSLLSMQREWGEAVKSSHPMAIRPEDRPPWEQRQVQAAREAPPGDRGIVLRNEGDAIGAEASTFDPGRNFVENRIFSIDEDYVEPILQRKAPKAGEVISILSNAFRAPIQAGMGQGNRFMPADGFFKPGTQEMHNRTRRNVQTAAHEIGHKISFEYPELKRMHLGNEVQEDIRRVSLIADEADASRNVDGTPTHRTFVELEQKNALPQDLQYIRELLDVSYDKNHLSEGVAELFRLWTTNNRKFGGAADLDAIAPNATKMLEQWKASLPRNQRKALDQFQKKAHEHLSLHGEAAFRTAIGPDKDPAAVLDGKLLRFRQNYVDDLAGAQAAEIEMFGQTMPGGFYESMRLLRGIAEASNRMLFDGAPTLVPDPVTGGQMIRFDGDSIADIFRKTGIKRGRQMDEAFRYFVALRAGELKSQFRMPDGKVVPVNALPEEARTRVKALNETREKLFSNEEISAVIRKGSQTPGFDEAARGLQDFAKRMAEFGRQAGLWNTQQMAQWQRSLFMFSFLREFGDSIRPSGAGSTMRGEAPTRQLKGSTRNLRDPFELLVQTHTRTFQLAMENMAKQKLLRDLSGRNGGKFGEFLKPIPDIRDVKLDDVKEAAFRAWMKEQPENLVEKLGTDGMRDVFDSTWRTPGGVDTISMFMGNTAPHGPDVMTVLVGGKPKHFRITDPMLIRSLAAMRRPQLHGAERLFNNLRRFKQGFITSAPGFIAANFARDTLMASIMSRTGHFHLRKSLAGLWGAITKDQDYKDFIANGGGGAGMQESYGSLKRKMLRHAQRTGFNPERLILDAVSVHRTLREISRVTEVASRLGEFKAARKMGHRASHAAFLGREVAADFGMRGESEALRFMANSIPFFNAMLVSGDRLFRGVAMDPSHRWETGLKIATAVTAGTALHAINRQIPQYNDLPEWDKNGYLHFFIQKWREDGERARVEDPNSRFYGQLDYDHYKMPALWEVGMLINMGRLTMDSMLGSEDEEESSLALDAISMLGANYRLNLFDKQFPLPIPAGADILVEQFSNKVLHTGNPIESQAIADQEAWSRKRRDQSRVMGEWGKLTREYPFLPDAIRSPARAEALLRGMFGEFASMGIALAESSIFPGGPETRTDRLPVVSRFFEGAEKYSKVEQDFWERYKEVREFNATQRAMAQKPNDLDTVMSMLQDKRAKRMMALDDQFARTIESIRELERYSDLLKDGALGYTPQEARKELDRTEIQIRSLMDAVLEIDRQIKKGESP